MRETYNAFLPETPRPIRVRYFFSPLTAFSHRSPPHPSTRHDTAPTRVEEYLRRDISRRRDGGGVKL